MLEYSDMFGEILRAARRARDWTQAELASRLGVTQPVISRWERSRGRPSPAQAGELRRLLGVSDAGKPPAPEPTLRPLPDREAPRLPLPLEPRVWQRPALTGDVAVCAALPRDDVLLAVLDTVGRGAAAGLAAHHLRGWLLGWIAGRTAAVRLDELANDLGDELRSSRLDATWFLAVLGRGETPHSVAIHMASHAFPAPLLLTGPHQETRETRPVEDPGQGSAEVSYVRHEQLEAPLRLIVATDGLLARLGAGDERAGKRSLLRWMRGVRRETAPERYLQGRETGDDETLVRLSWASWDEEWEFDAESAMERHEALRHLRRSVRDRWNDPALGDRAAVAMCEAVGNAARHAYASGGPIRVGWRHTRSWTQVEVSDEGVGGAVLEQGGFSVMRRHASAVDHWERSPAGKAVFLAFRGAEENR